MGEGILDHDDWLSTEATLRIAASTSVPAMMNAEIDRLRADLGDALIVYQGRRMGNCLPPSSKIEKHLHDLSKSAKRFEKDLRKYLRAGEPGLPHISNCAALWHKEAQKELEGFRNSFRSKRNTSQENRRQHSYDPGLTSEIDTIRDQISDLEQDLLYYEQHRAAGTPAHLLRGAILLKIWLEMGLTEESITALKDNINIDDKTQAEHWLIVHEIPHLWNKYTGLPKYSFSRRADSGEPCGPALDFAMAVLREFRVLQPRSDKPYARETVVGLWRDKGLDDHSAGQPDRKGRQRKG